jgi:alanine racemase
LKTARSMDKWVEIDDQAIINNLLGVYSLLSAPTRLIAVVKANAYGHGLVETARLLAAYGVEHFAVTFLHEALQLREGGIDGSILLLSPLVDQPGLKKAIEENITIMVASIFDAWLANQASQDLQKSLSIHLKIETGLNRFGLSQAEALQVCGSLSGNPFIYIEGIYTHMADAGASDPGFTLRQFQQFMQVAQSLEEAGYVIPIRHCANSAVTLRFPHMHLDAVRIGTLLSGQYPAGNLPKPITLSDPFQFKARIIAIKECPAGSCLGYSRTFRLSRAAHIAVVPAGFIDGIAAEVANPSAGLIDALKKAIKILLALLHISRFTIRVFVQGHPCPVVGKVFMQLTLVQIPSHLTVAVGEEVVIPVKKTLVSSSIARLHRRSPARVTAEGSQ